MDDLLKEISSDQSTGGTGCLTCKWIEGRDDASQWDSALANKEFSHSSIWRAMRKRGFTNAQAAVRNHRLNGHRQ